MAWTTPGTAVAGAVLEASFWNEQVRDNLTNLRGLANVAQTAVTATATTTSTSFADITGFSVAITPTATTSKVLVLVKIDVECAAAQGFFRLYRDATLIGAGATAGNRTTTSMRANANSIDTVSTCFLDSPSTTSATTYKIQWASNVSGQTIYLNRQSGDSDSAAVHRGISMITVQEIPA